MFPGGAHTALADAADGADEALDALDVALALLEAEDRTGWDDRAKSARVLAVLRRLERLGAETVRLVGEWDADRSWEADGALSAASWLAAHAEVSKRAAGQLVRTARVARRHERIGKSLASGDLSSAHADVLATATKGRTALLARDVDSLVDIAATLSVDDYTTAMKAWRSAADDAMARDDASLAFEERSVTWITTFDGRMEFRVSLDAEGGAVVVRALEAYDRPDPEPAEGGPVDGPRTVAQRHADGLVQIASEALGDRERARHHTPGVDGLIDVERLGHQSLGCGPGEAPGVDDAGDLPDWLRPRCELRGIGPVARDVLVRLACDGAVGRIVMRGQSEVLDVGRRSRVVPRALRRAVEVRDGHCAFPGCDAPLHWCDVHHLVHWEHGGQTNLDNCLLLCRRHHVLVHEGGWQLGRRPDGTFQVEVRGSRPRARGARRRGPPPARPPDYDLAA